MSTTMIIIFLLAALALIIGVVLASGERGPRVTHIDRTIKREKEDEE